MKSWILVLMLAINEQVIYLWLFFVVIVCSLLDLVYLNANDYNINVPGKSRRHRKIPR